MYLLIDFSTTQIDFQPTQTINSCEFSNSLNTLQNKLTQTIKNMNSILSDSEDLTTHTLVIIKLSEASKFIFNPMTSHYVFSENVILQSTYQSCDC